MAIRCPKCKGVIPNGEMFCRKCGFSIAKHAGALEIINEPSAPASNPVPSNRPAAPAGGYAYNQPSSPAAGYNQPKPSAPPSYNYGAPSAPAGQPNNYQNQQAKSNAPYGGYNQPQNAGQYQNPPAYSQPNNLNNQPPMPPVNQPGPGPAPMDAGMPAGSVAVKKKNNTPYIIIGVCAAVFVVALIMVIAIFSSGSKSDPYTNYYNTYEEVYNEYLNEGYVDLGGSNVVDTSTHGNYNSDFYSYPELPAADPASVPERTIMIYIVGSNLESQNGSASIDLDEMIGSGFNEDKTNVVVCAGGSSYWYTTGIGSGDCVIMEVTGGQLVTKKKTASVNMSDPGTLASFIEYSLQNYPAEEYGLILWNHGGGPVYGYGHDEVHSNTMMSIGEIAGALSTCSFGSENKLEFLGFDACLMASVEIASCFSSYADYLIASEESEPGWGWQYEFLSQIDRCTSGADIGRLIVDYYFAGSYEYFADNPGYKTDLTLSCLDLSQTDELIVGVNTLFTAVNNGLANGQFSTASRSRYQAKEFGASSDGSDFDLIDLGHFNSLLAASYSAEAEDVKNLLGEFVEYSKTNVEGANGVSVYHPYDDKANMSTLVAYYAQEITFSTVYAEYISNFADTLISGDSAKSTWTSFSTVKGEAKQGEKANELTMQLTPEQMETFSGAKYHVFRALDPTITFTQEVEYMPVFSGYDVSLSADGVLSASYDGRAVFGIDSKTGEVSDMPLAMSQIHDGVSNNKYEFSCLFFSFGDDIADWDTRAVDWQMEIQNRVPVLLSAYEMQDDVEGVANRSPLNYNDFETYQFVNGSFTIETDADGNVNFVSTGNGYGYEYSKENGFTIECRDITDKENYYVVFVCEDIYGNRFTSDFFQLP